MKKIIALLLLSCTVYSHAQQVVKGFVKDANGNPLQGATVYINNTTIGTISKQDGSFELLVNEGDYDVIISFLGYETVQHKLNEKAQDDLLTFVLTVKTNVLDEAVVSKTQYDDIWKHNLEVFKSSFLGKTTMAATCEILNPKVLHFEFDPKTGILTADARKPLLIKNKGLGYLITYDLIHFELARHKISFLGRAKYEVLQGNKRKQSTWTKNRLKAYKGSRMHFVRSLRNSTFKEEGFMVHQFKRVKNENRPSEDDIKEARMLLRNSSALLDFGRVIEIPKTKLDSALLTVRKSKLPKFRDYLYKKDVPIQDMMLVADNHYYLKFKDYLSITYLKESEEDNYLYFSSSSFSKKKKKTGVQTSAITLHVDKAILDPTGEIIEPLDYFSEGYWGYELFADTLPLDYQPPK